MSDWYPIYTKARAEKQAALALEQKGIEVYLPLQRQLKHWSDRKKWVEQPLIPSYLFVKINPADISKVLMCRGISRFIYFSKEIAIIPERQIDQLRLLLANATDLEVAEKKIEKGQNVVVKAGPLQGLKGELVSYHSTQRLLVRLDYISESILVQISRSFLEAL
jgi:transcriptional antiterminator RfaH